jgi:ABC-type multidrug transport system ATPase subunit
MEGIDYPVNEVEGILNSPAYTIVIWVLFSIALWLIARKLQWKRPWLALIPGVRYIALGGSLGMLRDGIFIAIAETLSLLNAFILGAIENNETASVAVTLILLVLTVFLLVYRIRLFLRLTSAFGRKRVWIVLWIFAEVLTALIFGVSRKFQPVKTTFEDDDGDEHLAGTSPAEIAAAYALHGKPHAAEGLSIALRERTARDLGKKRYLLKDISLDIPNGSLVMLLGGSGSGKTTLVNAVTGYEKADADVTLNGEDIYRNYNRMKYKIGFVPQQDLLRGSDTVYDTLDNAADMKLPGNISKRQKKDRIENVLNTLGLQRERNSLVSKLSGGQRKRLSIAVEYIADPSLFFLDEPDSGLDGVMSVSLMRNLRVIADEGKIVMVITHSPDRAADLFDKIIVLAKSQETNVGRLAFFGSIPEAKSFFEAKTLEGIVKRINRIDEGGDGRADEFIRKYEMLTAKTQRQSS